MIRSAGDSVVAGAEVGLIGGQLSTLSDAQGRFRLAGVRKGVDRVAVTGRGYETLVLPQLTFPGCGVIRLEVVLGAPQPPPELHPLPQPPPGMIIHPQRQPNAPIVIVDDRIAGRGDSVPDLTGLAIAKIQYFAPAQADSLYGSRAARGAYAIETGRRRDCAPGP